MSLILFILTSYGLTNVLCYGSIFDKIRPKNKFFHCPMCMGFWVGVLVSILFMLCGVSFLSNPLISIVVSGWLSSGTSYFLSMLVDDDGLKIQRKK